MNKLHLGFEEITKIYAEALEHETGMPVENLANVFDYDGYELNYDSLADKIIIKIVASHITHKIKGAYVQFEMDDTDIYVVNYGCGSGWQLAYSFAD